MAEFAGLTRPVDPAQRNHMALLLIVALFVLAWILLILPKQRELKRHKELVASLEVGDEVMTGSGFYGTLTEVDTDRVRLEVAPGVEISLARRAVAAKVSEPEVSDPEVAELGAGDDDLGRDGAAGAEAGPADDVVDAEVLEETTPEPDDRDGAG